MAITTDFNLVELSATRPTQCGWHATGHRGLCVEPVEAAGLIDPHLAPNLLLVGFRQFVLLANLWSSSRPDD